MTRQSSETLRSVFRTHAFVMGMRWSFCCRRSPGARQQLQDDLLKNKKLNWGLHVAYTKVLQGWLGSCRFSAIVGALKFLSVMHPLCERLSDLLSIVMPLVSHPALNTCLPGLNFRR